MLKYALPFALCATVAYSGHLDGAQATLSFLGEVHDNPAHHLAQAEAVAEIAPKALVFEMLTPAQAALVTPDLIADEAALGEALGWADSGWPDFAMYYPIFAAAPGAKIYGAAVPRDAARAAFETGVPEAFGDEAVAYGLTEALAEDQLAARLDMQMEAHCNALPEEMLPGMVELQRLRDATLARGAVEALAETGGPVAVITGNGHARPDWGAPSYVARVAPEVTVFTLGQSEDGNVPDGGFDLVLDAPAVDRPDPCEAFN